jgi:hypothetical protein
MSSPIRRRSSFDAHHTGLENLLPAERQQLTRQARSARCRVGNFLHVTSTRIALLEISEQQRAVAHDDSEQVVEIMRNATRQLSDCVHLLRLRQLLLEPHLTGEVAYRVDQHAGRESRSIDIEHPAAIEVSHAGFLL